MTDEIHEEATNGWNGDPSVKDNRPSTSAFKQQRLAAYQPILTAGTVLPLFSVIGIIFIPAGIGLWFISDSVKEVVIPYTDCLSEDISANPEKCADVIAKNPGKVCQCLIHFTVDEPLKGKVYMYYALTNFYQNHLKYVRSLDDAQLNGGTEDPANECQPPYQRGKNISDPTQPGKPYWPCGAIANSMFQDDITLHHRDSQDEIKLIRTGIAWASDKRKFKNPTGWEKDDYNMTQEKYDRPKSWVKNPWELDKENLENNGLQNEDFIVWMRTAALPNFRKLYRKIDHDAEDGFSDGVPAGNYTLNIKYSYPVISFGGTKSIIFSTTSVLGAKNAFLGFAYGVVGCICLFLGVLFLFLHIKFGKITRNVTKEEVGLGDH